MPITEKTLQRGAVLLRDPLSDVARKERRALLAVATAGYIVVRTGLVPSKIEALGITFSTKEQGALLMVFGLVVVYFTVTFILYAATDALTLAWEIYIAKKQLADEIEADLIEGRQTAEERSRSGRVFVKPERFRYRHVVPYVAALRGIWDVVLPVVAGVVVAVLLFRATR